MLLGRLKGKKWPKIAKSSVVPYTQEPYFIWSSYMVHICNRMIPPGFFNLFQIFLFGVNRGVKGQKWPKMTKNYVCHISCLKKHTSYDCDFGAHVSCDGISRCPFHSFKILILQVVKGVHSSPPLGDEGAEPFFRTYI